MKLIWHIFKKDVVRMRWALLLWVLLLAGEILLNRLLLSDGSVDAEWFSRVNAFATVSSFVVMAAGYVMMAGLALEDPLVGSGMFWVSRPISGARLLAAKLLGVVLLFGLLPFVVRLPWWLYCGFASGDLWGQMGQNLSILLLAAVPAITLAAIAGQSSRFLLFSLALLVAMPVMASLMAYSRTRDIISGELLGSRVILSLGIAYFGGMAVVAWQYLTRRLVVACVGLAGGLGLAVAVVFYWPWALDKFWSPRDEPAAGTKQVTAEIVGGSILPVGGKRQGKDMRVPIFIQIGRIPEEVQLDHGQGEVEFRWPDGTSLRSSAAIGKSRGNDRAIRHALGISAYRGDPETAAKWKEKSKDQPASPTRKPLPSMLRVRLDEDENLVAVTLVVPAEQAARIKADPPACSVNLRLLVQQPELMVELPLQAGASKADNGIRLHILEVGEVLRKRYEKGSSRETDVVPTVVCATAFNLDPLLYWVDRDRGSIRSFRSNSSGSALLARIGRATDRNQVPALWRTDQWVQDSAWVDRQTIAALRLRKLGTIEREVHTDRLEVADADNSPDSP